MGAFKELTLGEKWTIEFHEESRSWMVLFFDPKTGLHSIVDSCRYLDELQLKYPYASVMPK